MIKYKSEAVTIQNGKGINKPNEDYYLNDDDRGIYILVDGVSRDKIGGIYPNPSPAFHVSRLFTETVYAFLAERLTEDGLQEDSAGLPELLSCAVKKGNDAVRDYNSQTRWENEFLPGTVGIAAVVTHGRLYFAYIGDCIGLVANRSKNQFTSCQTEKIAAHKKEFTAFEIRNKICNNTGHPYSYGVWNGDPRAMDFLRCGEIGLEPEDRILLCSDGFSDVMERFSGEELYQMEMEQLTAASLSQDDRTMIRIEKEK